MDNRRRNPWIAAGKRYPEATRRLVCFAHAGGGSGLYAPWRTSLGPDIDVCPVVLPGREARLKTKPYRTIDTLIPPLIEGLWELTDRPLALFGHSLGSIIAYEVARQLTSLGRRPSVLMVSGRRAPHLPKRFSDVHTLDDDGVVDALRRLGGTSEELLNDRSLLEIFVPAIRADFELNETYQPLPGPRLDVDIIGFHGVSDPQLTEPELHGWVHATRGKFTHHLFDGGHFYLQPPPKRLLNVVAAELNRFVED
ncbi:thioesterase II family protein [Mycobacterium stomatepiae]|nr:alpha/beta fold hydrolase [Mycobacterium stomatepiae]MCV7163074.1 thioesterase [Mycobacterium stomatepiae]